MMEYVSPSPVERNRTKIRKGILNMKYVCNLCGWVYDEEEAGVKWEDLPDDFACELCGAGKDEFTAEE